MSAGIVPAGLSLYRREFNKGGFAQRKGRKEALGTQNDLPFIRIIQVRVAMESGGRTR
jgi:hypothetical protein